jgi:hypothetical protein
MAPAPKEVVITGVDISFFSAVGLMVKWSLASIPAMFIVSFLCAVFFAMGGGAVAAIAAAIGAIGANGAG